MTGIARALEQVSNKLRDNETAVKTIVIVNDAMALLQDISGLRIQPHSTQEAIGSADSIRRLHGAVVIMQWAPSVSGYMKSG